MLEYSIGMSVPVIPLTREVFGEDGTVELKGRLTRIDRTGGQSPHIKDELAFCEDGGERRVFGHPMFSMMEALSGVVSIRFSGGQYVLLTSTSPSFRMSFKLVTLTTVSVDRVVECLWHLDSIDRPRCCPAMFWCQSGEGTILRLRNTVFLSIPHQSDLVVSDWVLREEICGVCGPCYEKLAEKELLLPRHVYLDGRKLLPQAPVQIAE